MICLSKITWNVEHFSSGLRVYIWKSWGTRFKMSVQCTALAKMKKNYTSGKSKTWRNQTGQTYRFFDGKKPMTHPPPCGSVSADVSKTFLVVAVRCTEGHLLYSLVHNHTLEENSMRPSHYMVKLDTITFYPSFLTACLILQ